MRKIIKNSAKCTACGVVVSSVHRHDFNPHYCDVASTPGMKWIGEGVDMELVPSGKTTYRFAVDGGTDYLRRVGTGYEDVSQYGD